jgi:fatty-acyl-CoA synthase
VRLSLAPVGGLLGKVPFRSGEVTHIGAPVFHALGFAHMILGVVLGSTLVLDRGFDPARVLDSIARNRATALICVPVMIQRMLDLDEQAWAGRDMSSLRIVFVSGSQLGSELARRATNRLGPVLYNLYGSTEVAYATIATPEDLDVAPSTVGRVVRGSVVRILGDDGTELPPGQTGRVFVGNANQFEGYTGGGSKEQIDGLMASGDVGHVDADGRLFIDGRDDEMIISGGENVYPAEVEELLATHGASAEAAAIGVQDDQFGQRLRAFVVLREGTEATEDELKGFVRDNLARYKVPREIVFVDELPRNPTGKILKRELQKR